MKAFRKKKKKKVYTNANNSIYLVIKEEYHIKKERDSSISKRGYNESIKFSIINYLNPKYQFNQTPLPD